MTRTLTTSIAIQAPRAEFIPITPTARPHVHGKLLYLGEEPFYLRGVTYGTFRPNQDGQEYRSPEVVERDFSAMAANGINTVRVYTIPPRWLLDVAERHGLYAMIGLPWEQHVAFLDDRARMAAIEERVRAGVRASAGHPAVLCYTLGNEIPASIVRWYGQRRVAKFLEQLYRAVKSENPDSLVTYVNFPTTEYLRLPFVDFVCFNVYLEQRERLAAYLARLQNIVGNKPLVLAEIGLDSQRNGERAQADALAWQIDAAFAAGCAGAFVFAWTDEWYRGGAEIDDWDFGLTDRQRRPKPALAAVRKAFDNAPFQRNQRWPRVSVVVCSYNGAATIRDCLEGLARLHYPNYEVIVVDDGSTDATGAIAAEYAVRLISVPQGGLSNARNIGLGAAQGEIVAYIDDDAYPDAQWLTYLAAAFATTTHAALGGPNIAPPDDGPIAACVANAPGGPCHVLLTDEEAEHIPGCNMAFRKASLDEIGGFDPQFRTAGDDVDVCWRIQQHGWTIGYTPAAVVWHHRRNSAGAYWRQQRGYGRAEALLEQKWPHKYNVAGHPTWSGRIYGPGATRPLSSKSQVFHGTWGAALFQSVYQRAPGTLGSLPLMPEWYLIMLALLAFSSLGLLWAPVLLVLPIAILVVCVSLVQAAHGALQASFLDVPSTRRRRWKLYALTTVLFLLQPLARLDGRLRHGLTPWRWHGFDGLALPRPRRSIIWSERWRAPESWLETLEATVQAIGKRVRRGGDFDRWDLEVPGGLLGTARVLATVEEHGAGRQLVRLRIWPSWSRAGAFLMILFVGLAIGAYTDRANGSALQFGAVAVVLGLRSLYECAVALATFLRGVKHVQRSQAS